MFPEPRDSPDGAVFRYCSVPAAGTRTAQSKQSEMQNHFPQKQTLKVSQQQNSRQKKMIAKHKNMFIYLKLAQGFH